MARSWSFGDRALPSQSLATRGDIYTGIARHLRSHLHWNRTQSHRSPSENLHVVGNEGVSALSLSPGSHAESHRLRRIFTLGIPPIPPDPSRKIRTSIRDDLVAGEAHP